MKIFRKVDQRIYEWLRGFDIYRRLIYSFFSVIFLSGALITIILVYGYFQNTKALIIQNLEEQLDLYEMKISEDLREFSKVFSQISIDKNFYNLVIENDKSYEYIEDYIGMRQIYYKNKNEVNRLLYTYAKAYRMISGIYFFSDDDIYTAIFPWGDRMGAMPERDSFEMLIKDCSEQSTCLFIVDNTKYFIDSDGQSILLMGEIVIRGMNIGTLAVKISSDLISSNVKTQNDKKSNFIISDKYGLFMNDPTMPKPVNLEKIPVKLETGFDEAHGLIIASKLSANTGWHLYNIIHQDIILKSLYKSLILIGLITILIVMASSLIAVTVTRSISAPINALKREMKFTETNLEFNLPDSYNDEISLLGNKIQQMVQKIKQLLFELHQTEISKSRDQIKIKQAQLNALYKQINPHFIYNTMELIRAEVVLKNGFEDEAARMIEAFSALLRMGTFKADTLVPLGEELDHIRMYIDVLGFSEYYQDLKLNIVAHESVRQYLIPKLTLQPLVENCIKHGFEKTQENKEISIIASVFDEKVTIIVSDNGKTLNEEEARIINHRIKSSEKANEKFGLKNINDRISVLFGDIYGIHFHANQDEKIIVQIPCITKEDEARYEYL